MVNSLNALVVDNEQFILDYITMILAKEQILCKCFTDPRKALIHFKSISLYRVIILDIMMGTMNGISLLKQIKKINNEIPIILISGFAQKEVLIEAIREGAYDFLEKPINEQELCLTVKRAMETLNLKMENVRLQSNIDKSKKYIGQLEQKISEFQTDQEPFESIVGNDPKILNVIELIKRACQNDANVLIYGESGTGKELVAKAIHNCSPRKNKRFVPLNCSAIPENLLESELFGHEKGAFTGAVKESIGKFEYADKGTILLDEIGDMPLHLQAKLLRVLQERKINRIGSHEEIEIDVRIIASTNKNLILQVEEGYFREDIFYRLNVIPIELPPLRDRKDDIPLLATHFVGLYNKIYNKSITSFSDRLLEHFYTHPWRGNIRELKNLIEQLVILSDTDVLDFSSKIAGSMIAESISYYKYNDYLSLKDNLLNIEKKFIEDVVSRCGTISDASIILQIDDKTLYRKLRKHTIDHHDLLNLDDHDN